MKKTVFTLNVDDYCPEITRLTYPLLAHYAQKIGADFHVIDQRQYPEFPAVYEKLQIHRLGRDNDWNIYIDSDALVHPDFFDVTEHLHKDTVLHNGCDLAGNRWRYDGYFRRDGRHIGSCNWFTVGSNWCLDLWHPLEDLSLEQAAGNIFPVHNELQTIVDRYHLIDDYVLSRNIARYGLKFKTTTQLMSEMHQTGDYLWHEYTIVWQEKARRMRDKIVSWGLASGPRLCLGPAQAVEGWMTPDELSWLATQALDRTGIVEIGSYLGRSTLALADNTRATVLAIDDWHGPRDVEISAARRKALFAAFRRHLRGRSNVQPIHCDYDRLAELDLEQAPDMIFIDGDHAATSVRRDLNWAKQVMQPTGLLCGHDYERPEVRQAIAEVLGTDYQIFSGVGLLWWAFRKR